MSASIPDPATGSERLRTASRDPSVKTNTPVFGRTLVKLPVRTGASKRATRASGDEAALKVINTTKAQREPYRRFVQEIEFLRSLGDFPGVFAPLRDPDEFAKVRLWEEGGTICWPNGADVAPETLRAEKNRRAENAERQRQHQGRHKLRTFELADQFIHDCFCRNLRAGRLRTH